MKIWKYFYYLKSNVKMILNIVKKKIAELLSSRNDFGRSILHKDIFAMNELDCIVLLVWILQKKILL